MPEISHHIYFCVDTCHKLP